MKSFYDERGGEVSVAPVADGPTLSSSSTAGNPAPALIAVYDAMTAPPRVEQVRADSARDLIEALSTRTYQLSHEPGGQIPYTVIREVVENFIHAGFDEVVVSVLDSGRTIRFADQGPGIRDKERVFLPGFTTANEDMKHVIKGVGSGLPVARECLTFSGGTIQIDDNLGAGTVVTLRMDQVAVPVSKPEPEELRDDYEPPALSLRQKQVLSLAMELGSVGPTVVSRELGVGLSTAYRDLEYLTGHALISADESGKRVLTDQGIRCLDALFGR
ncbi:MAG: ATP-binding protein [Coriobacteriia bacterium]|nr:ATP-binding protein [Coriobacteriia bacterium]